MNYKQIQQAKQQLLTMFATALDLVNGENCVFAFLQSHPIRHKKIKVVAIGKAAPDMMRGALRVANDSIQAGMVITKDGYLDSEFDRRIRLIESDHPFPSERSLQAGQYLLDFICGVQSDELLLCLISGGTSALVEVLPDSITLGKLVELNNWCLHNSLSIAQINTVRQSISRIKAGRLLNYLSTHECIQLTISDVQGDDLEKIGSGLFVPPAADNSRTTQQTHLPDWIQKLEKVDPTVHNEITVEHHVIANNNKARAQIANDALKQGISVRGNETLFTDVTDAVQQIRSTVKNGPQGLYIWGGECVIQLPEQPGIGGRCQSLALALAQEFAGQNVVILAAGTDGCDGTGGMNGEVAGAIVDGATLERGLALGLDASAELAAANAGYYLAECGDLLDTGPTGTNVMDLILLLKLDNAG